MERKNYNNAMILYGLLMFLAKENKWYNVNALSRLYALNSTRLKKQLDDMVSRNMLERWDELSHDEQRRAKKEQMGDIMKKNNYKIKEEGRNKLEKIKKSCSEPLILMSITKEIDLEND